MIIGGGVGGTSIAYHLARARRARRPARRPRPAHERLDVPLGRAGRPAARLRVADEDDDALGRALPAARRASTGWVECGSLRLASTPERMEELRRQAGWARTFGLPLELISAPRRPASCSRSWPRRRARRRLPADGRLPRPLAADLRPGRRRARAAAARIHTHTRVTGIDVARRPRERRAHRPWATSRPRPSSSPAGMFAAELGRLAGVRIPIVPMAHEYVVTQPFRERPPGEHLPTHARPRPARLLPRGGRRPGHGRLRARSAPWSLDGPGGLDAIPPDFNGRLLEEDWDALRGDRRQRAAARAGACATSRVTRLINGPEAFTPDGEFCLGETEVARPVRRRGLLRPRAGRRGRHRRGAGRVDRRRRAAAGPLAHGRAALRPPLPLAVVHARPRPRGLRDLLRHQVPRPRAAGGPAAARLGRHGWHAAHGAAFGEKSGWERVNWYEANARRRRRGPAAARLGRASCGRPRSAPSTSATRERAGLFDESSFAKLAVTGPGAAAFLEHALRQPRRPRRRPHHLHADAQPPRRHRVRLHGHAARRGALLRSSPGRRSGPRPRLAAPPRAGDGSRARRGRHLGVVVLRAVGTAAPATSCSRSRPSPLDDGLPAT